MWRDALCLFACLAVWLPGVAGVALAQGVLDAPPPALTNAQGVPQALEWDSAHLMVGLRPGAELRGPVELPLPRGAVRAQATPLGGRAALVRLEGGTPAGLPGARDALLAREGVAWAWPSLRHVDTGALLHPLPQVVVRVDEAMTAAELTARLPGGLRVGRPLRGMPGTWLLELTQPGHDHPLHMANDLRGAPWVRAASMDAVGPLRKMVMTNDPLLPNQWHLVNTGQGGGTPGADANLALGWEFTQGTGATVIAVVDDGVELAHPDLWQRIYTNPNEIAGNGVDDDGNGYVDDVSGWDFCQDVDPVYGDNNPNPLPGFPSHGTAVAGVAAAHGGNGLGVTGACPNCRILPLRIFCDDGYATSYAMIAEAITYAGQYADIINGSWGGPAGLADPTVNSAIQGAATSGRPGVTTGSGLPAGALPVFASGNYASGYYHLYIPPLPAGDWQVEFAYVKNISKSAGDDTAWLDNVRLPDGTLYDFEGTGGGCALDPAWALSGNADWFALQDGRRAASALGGECSAQAGFITGSQSTAMRINVASDGFSALTFDAWVSAERANATGTGPIVGDDGAGAAECADGLHVNLYDSAGAFQHRFYFLCGTFNNQGSALEDGVLSWPAIMPETLAVGASTNLDYRAEYSQWGTGLDVVAPSGGGTLRVVTTDVRGTGGYSDGNPNTDLYHDTSGNADYTNAFGGTSSATPLVSGVAGLYLSLHPCARAAELRVALRTGVRNIGPVPDDGTGWNSQYGYGVIDAAAVLNFSAPTGPTVDAHPAQTMDLEVMLSGTKPAGTALLINCQVAVAAGPETTWNLTLPLQPGPNTFSLTARAAGVDSHALGVEIYQGVAVYQGGAPNPPGIRGKKKGSGSSGCLIRYMSDGWLADETLHPLRAVRGWLWARGAWGQGLVRGYYRLSAGLIGRWEGQPPKPLAGPTASI